ncbi:MAG: hypothetical protein QN152_05560 [Armatimonadota bacterium]|nr:hypothetical protein [Armatimonadota bacterium]MDR7538987.1 hypothetical protein [Armatimonadota bacterium]
MPRTGHLEEGMAVIPVLVVVLVVSAIGLGLVGVMNTDITHATIQGVVSRSFYVAQAGLQEAIVRLKGDPNYRTPGYPAAIPPEDFAGGQFWIWVEDHAEDVVQITSRGRATTAGRTATAEVRATALVGPPVTFGLFGVSTVEAQGANSRTYLAPWRPSGPGVPRGANMGSFQDINFQDSGSRLNALSETSVETLTLRDGTFNDWELFGFESRPVYSPDPSVDPAPWILGVFGDIVKAQPERDPWPHSCTPLTYYACLTVRSGSTDIATVTQLRVEENVRHVYVNRIRRRILPAAGLDSEPLLQEARRNTANAAVNRAAGITTPDDAVYTAEEFHCLQAYLSSTGGQIRGTVYVSGDVQVGGSVRATCEGRTRNLSLGSQLTILDGTLAIEGNLVLDQNASLAIPHDIFGTNFGTAPADEARAAAAREKVALALFRRGSSTGRFVMLGGSQSKFTADGLVYTSDGMEVGPQAMVDLIGVMYHNTANHTRPSFLNNNGTTVIRYDPLAASRLSSGAGIGVTVLSWQQLR